MKKLIGRLYYWFWHDVCRLPEPFSHTMRRSAKKHPALWIGIPTGVFVAWYLLVCHLWGIW